LKYWELWSSVGVAASLFDQLVRRPGLMAGPLGNGLEQFGAPPLATGDLTIQVPQFGGDETGRTATAISSMGP